MKHINTVNQLKKFIQAEGICWLTGVQRCGHWSITSGYPDQGASSAQHETAWRFIVRNAEAYGIIVGPALRKKGAFCCTHRALKMKLIPLGKSDNRHSYLRCHNKGNDEFVCVKQSSTFEQRDWLIHHFDTVTVRGGTLPEWRLYHVVPD